MSESLCECWCEKSEESFQECEPSEDFDEECRGKVWCCRVVDDREESETERENSSDVGESCNFGEVVCECFIKFFVVQK